MKQNGMSSLELPRRLKCCGANKSKCVGHMHCLQSALCKVRPEYAGSGPTQKITDLISNAEWSAPICRIETDPQALWVRPGSRAAQERASYDTSFGPFYRIEQLLIRTKPTNG